jgi:exonuclease III
MPKAFSLASWNVERFHNEKSRIARVVKFLKSQSPDVLALYEVVGKTVFGEIVKQMPGYQFHITEGPQVQEILVGVRKGFTAFFTQRIEFKTGNPALRPGALLTLSINSINYTILFLHTKSSTAPAGLGLRDDMFRKAFKLRRALDKAAGGKGKSRFIFVGDLNTMGMVYPFKKEIIAPLEIKKLDRDAKRVRMRRLAKDRPHTWWNGSKGKYAPADLDHVVSSDNLAFKKFSAADVTVKGWPSLGSVTQQDSWIRRFSDHGLLLLEVQSP